MNRPDPEAVNALSAQLAHAHARHDRANRRVAVLEARGPEHLPCARCGAQMGEPCIGRAWKRATDWPRPVHTARLYRHEDELRELNAQLLEAREALAHLEAERITR